MCNCLDKENTDLVTSRNNFEVNHQQKQQQQQRQHRNPCVKTRRVLTYEDVSSGCDKDQTPSSRPPSSSLKPPTFSPCELVGVAIVRRRINYSTSMFPGKFDRNSKQVTFTVDNNSSKCNKVENPVEEFQECSGAEKCKHYKPARKIKNNRPNSNTLPMCSCYKKCKTNCPCPR